MKDASSPSPALESTIASLKSQIAVCETQLKQLKCQLVEAENARVAASATAVTPSATTATPPLHATHNGNTTESVLSLSHDSSGRVGQPHPLRWTHGLASAAGSSSSPPLRNDEYKRYGRQLIMPEVGLLGQTRLKASSVLLVGVGGLGCPAAAYLAGAGVGRIGLMDGDEVEESNLHRQILHSTERVGMSKVDSALVYLRGLNPNVKYIPHRFRLQAENALDTFREYDLVLDCTDTPASRYLISDACVLLGLPLVSASALRTEGQLMVLNNPPRRPGDSSGGPCYRCVFPKPPPAESVVSCGDGGVLGPVVGVMGVLQALEAIKVITAGIQKTRSEDGDGLAGPGGAPEPASLLIFSAYGKPPFRAIRLRPRKASCAACSTQATVTTSALEAGSMDYVQFCGSVKAADGLQGDERLTADAFARQQQSQGSGPSPPLIVDVRERVQFELCHLAGSINVPFSAIMGWPPAVASSDGQTCVDEPDWVRLLRDEGSGRALHVVCRLGNDSQLAVRRFGGLGLARGTAAAAVVDVQGGLGAYRQTVDPNFPDY